MRFVDASVFVHAYLKPRRKLSAEESGIKSDAQKIVSRISSGEEVLTTAVHLSEVANLVEEYLPLDEARSIEEALTYKDSIAVVSVSRQDCISALRYAKELKLGLTDAMAFAAMKASRVTEVYSFDRDFDAIQGVRRVRS